MRAALPVAGLVLFFGVWELWVQLADVKPFILRAPSAVLATLADDPVAYLRNTFYTGRLAVVGFLVALTMAFVVGTVLALAWWMEQAASAVLILVVVTPFVAYTPSVVVWLGFGWQPIVFVTALVCSVPFIYAVTSGLRSADPATLDVLHSVDARWWEVVWRIRLPSALPQIFTAARVNVGLALIATWLTEQFALVNRGLGVIGKRAVAFNDGELLWASVFCTAALGIVGLGLLGAMERVVLRWHASQRDR
jgi:NitT/TauT family transport system permease protein